MFSVCLCVCDSGEGEGEWSGVTPAVCLRKVDWGAGALTPRHLPPKLAVWTAAKMPRSVDASGKQATGVSEFKSQVVDLGPGAATLWT